MSHKSTHIQPKSKKTHKYTYRQVHIHIYTTQIHYTNTNSLIQLRRYTNTNTDILLPTSLLQHLAFHTHITTIQNAQTYAAHFSMMSYTHIQPHYKMLHVIYFTAKSIQQDISLTPSQNTLYTISNCISEACCCLCNDTATRTCSFSWASPQVQVATCLTVLGYSWATFVTVQEYSLAKRVHPGNIYHRNMGQLGKMCHRVRVSCHLQTTQTSVCRKCVNEKTLYWLTRPVAACVRNWSLTSSNF